MTSRLARAPTDPAAFVAWESRRAPCYELVGGDVRLMAGGNRAHDPIAVNPLTALRGASRGGGCDVHGSNLKVVSPVGMVTYPDLFVRCGPLPDEALACDDPVAIVEVLSPSMRSEDLVRKRWSYQAIPACGISCMSIPPAARSRSRPTPISTVGRACSCADRRTACRWSRSPSS